MITCVEFCGLIKEKIKKFNLEVTDIELYSNIKFLGSNHYQGMLISLWSTNKLFIHFWHSHIHTYDFEWIQTEDVFNSIIKDYFNYNCEKEVITALMETYDKNYFGNKYGFR